MIKHWKAAGGGSRPPRECTSREGLSRPRRLATARTRLRLVEGADGKRESSEIGFMIAVMYQWLLGLVTQNVVRQHPVSAVALVVLGVVIGAKVWDIHLSERIKVLEQQIAAAATRDIVPLPSPISLGDSRNTYRRGTGLGRWSPAPGYVDATIDWGSIPVNMEIFAEAFVSARLGRGDQAEELGGPPHASARLRDVTMRETVVSFGPVDTRHAREPQRFTSTPLPRGVSVQAYRLEVSADTGVGVNARGRLLYRRR